MVLRGRKTEYKAGARERENKKEKREMERSGEKYVPLGVLVF